MNNDSIKHRLVIKNVVYLKINKCCIVMSICKCPARSAVCQNPATRSRFARREGSAAEAKTFRKMARYAHGKLLGGLGAVDGAPRAKDSERVQLRCIVLLTICS